MRSLKHIPVNVLSFFIFSFLFFTFLTITTNTRAQEAGCFKPDNNNELVLDGNMDFKEYDAFFVGEFHGVYGVSEIKLALIKYLNKQYGITDVFMETGFSTAWLYNKYLETGDTTLFTTPVLSYAQKKPNRDFWKSLYVYNKRLPHKIVIHGMDFERMNFIKTLRLLMPPGRERPAEIQATLHYIDTIAIGRDNADMHDKEHPGLVMNRTYDSIRANIIHNREAYSRYYSKDFKEVEHIMLNENTFARYAERNKTMYNNVMAELETNGIKKFIVFSGLNHGDMSNALWRTLCYRLMNTGSLKHKLVNIAMVCKNCYDWQLQPQYQHAAFRAPASYSSDTMLLGDLFKEHFNRSCRYTLLKAEEANSRKVSNFSHYLVLMQDQPEY